VRGGQICIFAATLAIGTQFPGAHETDGGEKPEDDRRQSAEGKTGESEDDEKDSQSGEKDVHNEWVLSLP
jgi:hypothetical protein